MGMSAMFIEKLHASSPHAVNKVTNVCLGDIVPFVNQPRCAGQQQPVAPVDDHAHGVLANPTDVLWDPYRVTSLAIPSTEYHVA